MQLEIRERAVKFTEELRNHLNERMESALGRFARSIKRVRVYLRDVNGPRGGMGKQCRIAVDFVRGGSVVVTGLDPDIYAAVSSTASRAGFAVRRRVKQRLARRRSTRRAAAIASHALIGA